MKLNGLCRGHKSFVELAVPTRPNRLPNGLRGTLNATKRVDLRARGYHTVRPRDRVHGWSIGAQRPSSNSAIKHLVSGTSTTLWLYNDLNQAFDPNHDSPGLSNATLVGLVKDGKMGAADRLRLQLIEQGVEIKPHPIYEQAAIANLRWTDMAQCLDQFTTWFSLVPEYDQSNPPAAPGPFNDTRRVLIHSGWPSARLPLILRFGIICASKGYLQPVLHEILPLVVRFGSANNGARWLYEMEQAAVEYQSIHHPREAEETARRYRTFTIDFCCQEGWLDHAMAIVRLERSFSLPTPTYTLLIRTLKNAGRLDDVEEVERCLTSDASQAPLLNSGEPVPLPFPLSVVDRWKPATEIVGGDESPISRSPSPTTAPRSEVTMSRDPVVEDPKGIQEPAVSRRSVAEELRSFKRSLRNRSCPDPFYIVRFLSDFKTVGGSQRVVTWLRHRALSNGQICSIKWIRAELRYHNIERNYEEILKLYLTYLNTTEVPLPGIFDYTLTRIAAQHRFDVVPARLPKCLLLDRWLVLKPIILLALNLPWPLATIRALHASYRPVARKYARPFTREPNEILSAFIAAYGECGSPKDATRVLRDCGDTPYLRQVETLAAVLARAGKVGQAMRLLGRIEGEAEAEAEAEDWRKGKRKNNKKKKRKGMRVMGYDGQVGPATPRLTTYGRMIEGFTAAGLLKPALEVERRMMKRLKYEYGQGTKLDEAMTKLWALEMERAGKV